MLSCLINEEKFPCLKYLDNTFLDRSSESTITKVSIVTQATEF